MSVNERGDKYSAQRKYDKENAKQISLKFNKKTDELLLGWLGKQTSVQSSIKSAVYKGARAEMFEVLREMIMDHSFEKNANRISWGGAGAAISKDNDDSWAADDSLVYYQTDNAPAFIWLIEQLKPLANVDYLSKYNYYPFLIETIKESEAVTSNVYEAMIYVVNMIENGVSE